MTPVIIVIAVVIIAGLAALAVTVRRTDQQTIEFDAAGPVRRIEATVRSGAVTVVAGGPVPRVHRTIRWSMARPATVERVDGDVLRIETRARRPGEFGAEVTYRIEVPAPTAVRASTGAGTLTVEATSGEVDLRTGAGQVTLTDLSGRVHAGTRAGTVQGTGLACPELIVETNAGSIVLTFIAPPDRVEARTNAGSVEVTVPAGPADRYAVNATAYAGHAEVDIPHDPTATRRIVVHSNAGAVRVRGR
jgi:hypothetical protein